MRGQWLMVAIVAFVLGGCATSPSEIKASVRSVRIEPVEVARPSVPHPSAALIGPTAFMKLGDDVAEAYQQIVTRNVDVGGEVTQRLKAHLQQKGFTVAEPGAPADAKLMVSVHYTLANTGSAGYRAVGVAVVARLVRLSDEKEIWTKLSSTGMLHLGMGLGSDDKASLAKIESAPFKRWLQDEAFVAEQHRLGLQLVADHAMNKL